MHAAHAGGERPLTGTAPFAHIPIEQRLAALQQVLLKAARLSGKLPLYASAMAALALVAGLPLPAELVVLASGLGANVLSGFLLEVVHGKEVSPDALREKVEAAFDQENSEVVHALNSTALRNQLLPLLAALATQDQGQVILERTAHIEQLLEQLLSGERDVSPGSAGDGRERAQSCGLGPVHIPALPERYLPRERERHELKALLLHPSADRLRRVVLHGMAGVGKSTLAIMAAQDQDVQRAFPDGVLRAVLGREPDLRARLEQWVSALEHREVTFRDVQQGTSHLSTSLNGKACLLILDDVWHRAHVDAFNVQSPRSCLLMTTREHGLALELGAAAYPLGVLSEAESLALLARRTGEAVENLPAEAREIADRCGNLPLALDMAAGQVRGPDRWGSVLRRLSVHFGSGGSGVFDVLETSVSALDPAARMCYFELAVFPRNSWIPRATLEKLWGTPSLNTDAVNDILGTLLDRSLLQSDGHDRFTLHEVQRGYVTRQMGDERLPLLHTRLLEAYRSNDGWADLPRDEQYMWRHLAYHLTCSGEYAELESILLDFDWLQAKLQATDVRSLMADYELLPVDSARFSACSLVHKALRLAAPVLAEFKGQLAGQLIGRLSALGEPGLRPLLARARRWQEEGVAGSGLAWLEPLSSSLDRPGGQLDHKLTTDAAIAAVALTPDGKRAVTASGRVLQVWDLAGERLLRELQGGHGDDITALAIVRQGRQIVSASKDRSLVLWDLQDCSALKTLQGHTGPVYALAEAADRGQVLSASEDKRICVWTLSTGDMPCVLEEHVAPVHALAVSGAGHQVVSGSDDGEVKVWDLELAAVRHRLEGHQSPVRAAAAVPGVARAITASDDAAIRVWDLESGAQLDAFSGGASPVYALAVTPDGQKAVSGSADSGLCVWDLASTSPIEKLEGHTGAVYGIAITPDGQRVVSVSADHTLRVWNLGDRAMPPQTDRHLKRVTALAVTPDGMTTVSAADDGSLMVWDVSSGLAIDVFEGHTEGVTALAITQDGRRAVSASLDGAAKVWDLESGRLLHTLSGHQRAITALILTADGRRAVSGSSDATVRVWDLESGAELRAFSEHSGAVTALALGCGERLIISRAGPSDAELGPTLTVCNAETGELLRTLHEHSDTITCLAVAADGSRVFSASDDGTIVAWAIESGTRLYALAEHSSGVHAVMTTGDAQLLISADEHAVRLWDLANREIPLRLDLDSVWSPSLAVSRDGSLVVIGWDSGTLSGMLSVLDVRRQRVVASFTVNSRIMSCAIACPEGQGDRPVIVAGDDFGRVHFLRLNAQGFGQSPGVM